LCRQITGLLVVLLPPFARSLLEMEEVLKGEITPVEGFFGGIEI
jgi:hypothetical protein